MDKHNHLSFPVTQSANITQENSQLLRELQQSLKTCIALRHKQIAVQATAAKDCYSLQQQPDNTPLFRITQMSLYQQKEHSLPVFVRIIQHL